MNDCQGCPLHKDALNVCVEGRGNPNARILIVGQNPGAQEDFENSTFVGKSGKVLDSMLASAGFGPNEYWMTNAVRCVTPQNRPPRPDEVKACRDINLYYEIKKQRPEVIIALGEVALRTLVGPMALSKVRGQELQLHKDYNYECVVIPTFHPAFVLRVPQSRDTVVVDLRRILDRLREPEKLTILPDRTGPACGPVIAYDIETYNTEGKITDKPTQIATASDDEVAFVSPIGYVPSYIEILGDILEQTEPFKPLLVSHNGWQFDDLKTGLASDYDTMAMAYLDDETQPLNLESVAVKYLGLRGWKDDHASKLGSPELVEYNGRDAITTLRVFYVLKDKIGERGMRLLDEILRPARRALDEMTKRGIYIDATAVASAKQTTLIKLEAARVKVEQELDTCGFPRESLYKEKQLKTKVRIEKIEFNPASNDHVGKILEWLGFMLPETDTGKPKVDKETLAYIDHPFARAMETFREVTKQLNTYIEPYEEIATTLDRRAHNIYKITNTDTGRSSASAPNVQNLDRKLKDFFSAPPGHVLVSADYASIEFRMGGFIANESNVVGNYQTNAHWDPHTWFASILYNMPEDEITKDSTQRQEAKSANFSQEYLGTGETLRAYMAREMNIFITSERADQIHRAWHKAMPGWRKFYAQVKEELLANGYVESLTGRRRHFGDVSLMTREQLLEALRQAVNFKVQSFCADIAFLALRFCAAMGLPIVCFIHDDIKFEFKTMEQAKQCEDLIRRCMIDMPLEILKEKFGIEPTVPIVVEFTYKQAPAAGYPLPEVCRVTWEPQTIPMVDIEVIPEWKTPPPPFYPNPCDPDFKEL